MITKLVVVDFIQEFEPRFGGKVKIKNSRNETKYAIRIFISNNSFQVFVTKETRTLLE